MREAEQFAFEPILQQAEEAEHAARDAHRTKVQAWFDALPARQKDELGDWMYGPEWHTCQALSAAACAWHRSTSPGLEAAAKKCKPQARMSD